MESAVTYTALGGSNTCGHGLRAANRDAFQTLVSSGLAEAGTRPVTLQPSCIPAMGPDYPASCIEYFAPNTTAFATLEFTPNMGEGRELMRNTVHLEQMARGLMRRGSRVVIVSLVPRPPDCSKCIREFEAAHARVQLVARRARLPLISMFYNTSTWSADLKHLNAAGHQQVAAAVLKAFASPASRGGRDSDAGGPSERGTGADSSTDGHDDNTDGNEHGGAHSGGLPTCVFGQDLVPLMLPGSRGFGLTWQVGRHRDKPGLLATEPGSVLRLCLRGLPPSFGVSLALERSDVLPMGNVTLGCESPCSCPLELLSNGDWTLRYSGHGTRRATESYMHRVFGARRGVAHDLQGGGSDSCDCVLMVRHEQHAGNSHARIKLNGLVAGGSGRIGWANRFHMGLNPHVLSG